MSILTSLVCESDIIVAQFSNLALEAAAFGRPVLVYHEAEWGALPVPYDEMGVAVVTADQSAFVRAFVDLASNGPLCRRLADTRRGFFERNPLLVRQGSAAAAVAVMRRLTSDWKPETSGIGPDEDLPSGFARPWHGRPPHDFSMVREGNRLVFTKAGVTRQHRDPAGDAVARRTLVVFAPGVSGDTGIELLEQLDPWPHGMRFLVPTNALSSRIAAHLRSVQSDDPAANLLLPYLGYDSANDDRHFGAVATFVEAIERHLVDAPGRMDDTLSIAMRAAGEGLIDRLVPSFRLAGEILRLAASGDFDEVMLVPDRAAAFAELVPAVLSVQPAGGRVCVPADVLPGAVRDAFDAALTTCRARRYLRLGSWPRDRRHEQPPNPLVALAGRDTLIVANAADRQYRETVLQLLAAASAPHRFGIVAGVLPEEAEEELRTGADGTPLVSLAGRDMIGVDPQLAQAWLVAFLTAQREVQAAHMHDESGIGVRRYLFAVARSLIPRTVSYACTLLAHFEEAVRGRWFRSVMVTPGRLVEARIAVPLARRHGIPTLDVQAGTISACRRFRPPLADRITVIDRVHREINRDYFKVPESAIEVVGAPRIDRHLAPVRAMRRAETRRALFAERGEPDPGRLFLLATQPIEREKLAAIVRVVFGALEGLCPVLVKPHPKEPPENLALYESVAREEFGRTRVIVDPAADVYRAIVAADGVATYFSTIALEAFALKRPVYVIDPFDAPPALDFAAAGLGARIRAAAELRAGVAAVLAGEACRGAIHDDPYFAVLQDGRSAERILAILERMIGEAAMPGAA